MTLRTALVIDGNAQGATAAANQAAGAVKQVQGATSGAAATTRQLTGASQQSQAAISAQTAAVRANTAAMAANNAATRQAVAQRTNLIFQLNDIFVSLASGQNPAMVAIQQGSQISAIYGPGGLGKALSETGSIARGLATKFAPLLVLTAAISAGIAGMTYEINRSGNAVKVSFGDVALGAVQAFTGYLYQFMKPAIDGIGKWFEESWATVTQTTSDVVNFIVREIVGGTDIIVTTLLSIPDAIAVGLEAALQAIADGITWIIQNMIAGVNSMIHGINGITEKAGLGRLLSDMGEPNKRAPYSKVDIGGAAASERLAGLWGDLGGRQGELSETDFAGGFFADVAANARENALARDKDKKAGKQSDYAREIEQIRERTAALQVEANVIGLSTFAAEKARKTLELETAAKKDAIGLSAARIAEIEKEATAYAKISASLEQQKAAYQQVAQIGASAFDQLTDSILDGGKNIGDVLTDLAKQYAKFALQLAITNPMQNAMFGANLPTASGGGIGGMIASFFSGLFGGARAAGGPVSAGRAYLVGERRPELFVPGMNGTILPNTGAAYGGGGGSFVQNITNNTGQPIRTKERRDSQGNVIQDMVIGTVKKGIAEDDFRSTGLRGPTKSR